MAGLSQKNIYGDFYFYVSNLSFHFSDVIKHPVCIVPMYVFLNSFSANTTVCEQIEGQ